jgi:tetratricopeptide (TPR) repeat protein
MWDGENAKTRLIFCSRITHHVSRITFHVSHITLPLTLPGEHSDIVSQMKPLEPPDTYCLSAAIGWLELGNLAEAKAELAQIEPVQQNHPDVLEVRWLLCAEGQSWKEGLEVARALLQAAPKRATGWLHQAYALRRVPEGGVRRAWDALLPAFDKFPKEPTIAYNLSCYACQMNQLDKARIWLKRAFAVGGKERITQMALADPDLEPLWPELAGM